MYFASDLNKTLIRHIIKADLHLHSNYSDGKYSPEELVIKAKNAGLSIISITDHDNINALGEADEAGKRNNIQVIPGIEFSADLKGKEVHILAYFIEHENKSFIDYVSALRQKRFDRFKEMITILNELGSNVKLESIINGYPENISFGRPHLAIALYKEGFVKSYAEAFFKYIGDKGPANVKKPNPPVNEVIENISKFGGLSFLAHPGKYFRDSLVTELIENGINGIEVIHPSHTEEDVKYFSKIASGHSLLECGGSDFHGTVEHELRYLGKYFTTDNAINKMKSLLQ